MKKNNVHIHQDLIFKCRRGNQEAQFEIYRLYYKAMYNTVLRIVNNSAEAEDIMQETFLLAFDKIETYQQEVSFGAWLKRIAVNRSIDYLRKKKINLENIEDTQYTEPNESYFDIDDNEEKIRMVKLIKKAITRLDDGFRIVLSLNLLEGYDHDEISQILGITTSTSRSQLSRAKKRLLKILSESISE